MNHKQEREREKRKQNKHTTFQLLESSKYFSVCKRIIITLHPL